MVSSVDGRAGAAAVGSSGAAAASRSCVGGGNRGLGRAGPRLYAGRAGKPAAGHRARLATLGICCTAPKSRSKATIRVIRVDSNPLGSLPVFIRKLTCGGWPADDARRGPGRAARPEVGLHRLELRDLDD